MELDKKTYEICLNIVKGCHDYNGGHHDDIPREAFHHGVQTVINAMESLQTKGFDDSQVNALYRIGLNT